MTNRSARMARTAPAVAALTVALVALTACSDNSDDVSPTGGADGADGGPVTISMAVWGGFGLDSLIADYQGDHPDVVIDLQTGDYNPLHEDLQREIVAGAGAPTIAVVGEDYIAKFAAQPEEFIDLSTLGADDLEASYLPWKWQQGKAPNGALVGIGAEVSGLALCYRADLFEAAGLPADRAAVTEAMGDSIDGITKLGAEYVDAAGGPFLDNASSLLTLARQQAGVDYYAEDGTLDLSGMEQPFAVALDAVKANTAAGIIQFSEEWDQGLSNGAFAATLCPAWMMGYIDGTMASSGSDATWDVAPIPGGGNWGGSFYTIPAQASEAQAKAAWEFLTWLTAPEQQLRVFQATGSLPSQPALYTEPEIADYTVERFNDAPVGQILGAAVTALPVQPIPNAKSGTIESTLQQVLQEVQTGDITPDEAWAVAQEAAKQADAQG